MAEQLKIIPYAFESLRRNYESSRASPSCLIVQTDAEQDTLSAPIVEEDPCVVG